jgi:mono/diheme cytochrome c family protein
MLAVAVALTWGVTAVSAKKVSAPTALEVKQQRVQRGAYLVSVLACHDCHTPWVVGPKGPEPDMTRALSGHPQDLKMPPAPKLGEGPWVWVGAGTNTAFAGPWGISYTANLTPDRLTGIGIWSEETFVKTIRTGRHWGVSRPILPPMPWHIYRNLNDEDLKSVYAYLRTIKPIQNQVPEPAIAGGQS